MFFENKDPRYGAPLLPAVALISAVPLQSRKVALALLFPLLVFEHHLVSFAIPRLPEAVVLMKGREGPLSWNWNLYTQTYFGLWGRPAREDWKIEAVLDRITASGGKPVRLGMIPDIPRFDSQAFEFYIELGDRPVVVHRLWTFDEEVIRDNDFILMSEKGQGFALFFSGDINRINHYVLDRPERFEIEQSFDLPNDEVIRLYRVIHDSSALAGSDEPESGCARTI